MSEKTKLRQFLHSDNNITLIDSVMRITNNYKNLNLTLNYLVLLMQTDGCEDWDRYDCSDRKLFICNNEKDEKPVFRNVQLVCSS